MPHKLKSSSSRTLLFCSCALMFFLAACNRGPSQPAPANSQTATKRYSLKGKVISIDQRAAAANIENEPIAGFMDSMVMPYTIKPTAALDQLHPGDSITADVVVEPGKYWLENVKVTGHAEPPATKPAAAVQAPVAGDEPPRGTA
jgi:protein SCO1/2